MGDDERNAMVMKNRGLAYKTAMVLWKRTKWIRRLGTIEDVQQVAMMALMNAVASPKYDPKHVGSFRNYCITTIRHAVAREALHTGLIRMPQWISHRYQRSDASQAGLDACFYITQNREPEKPAGPPDQQEWHDHEDIVRAMALLTPLQRQILTARYGLTGQPPMKLREVGVLIGKTKERARQLQEAALRDMAVKMLEG